MAVITFTWSPGGVPTDVYTAKLSAPDGTYGVRRTDTDVTVVADGTNMTHAGTGTYTYDLGDISVDHQAWVEIVEDEDEADVYLWREIIVEADAADGSESTLSVTRTDLRRFAAREKGYSLNPGNWSPQATTAIDDIVKEAERLVYTSMRLPGENSIHSFSFLQPVGEFDINPAYSDGTVAITTGTVTLTGGTWPSWAADAQLIIDGVAYDVASRTDNDTIVLTNTSVTGISGESYSLEQWKYALPADFASFKEPYLNFTDDGSLRDRVKQVGVSTIQNYRASNWLAPVAWSYPSKFAVVPLNGPQTSGQRYELWIDQVPSSACTLTGPYKANPFAVSASAPYPLGGMMHAQTFKAAVRAAVEIDTLGAPGPLHAEFLRLLADSIARDREQHGTKSFGYNGDRSGGREFCDYRDYRRGHVSFPSAWGN